MKVHRSTKVSLKYATASKLAALEAIRVEYSRIVNSFIDIFWNMRDVPENRDLVATLLHKVDTHASQRLVKEAAREARSMVATAKHQPAQEGIREVVKPRHYGKRMVLAVTIAKFEKSAKPGEFDGWLRLEAVQSVCGVKVLRLPIKLHRHFNKLADLGTMASTVVVFKNAIQFSFEIETGEKLGFTKAIGVDTGINTLGMTNEGRRYGKKIKEYLNRLDRCEYGSAGYSRAKRRLKQSIDVSAKKLVAHAVSQGVGVIVTENLKGITFKTKSPRRRRGLKMRRWIGRWNVQYWLSRLQAACETNRIRFASVSPYKTSQTCPSCNHVDPLNRNGELFECLKCGLRQNADVVGAQNIVARFTTGKYGSGFKASTHSFLC